MKRPKTVDEYIATSPTEVQAKLRELRKIILTTAPKAEEKISYGMPYYGYKGRLAYFAAAKNHLGLYIMPYVLVDFEREVKGYRTGEATLQFAYDQDLPVPLIKKLLRAGVEKNEARNAKT